MPSGIYGKTVNEEVEKPAPEKWQNVSKTAFQAGTIGAAKAAVVSVPTVLLLDRYYSFFKSKNVTAKALLAITPPIFAFYYYSQEVAARVANPQAFHGSESVEPKSPTPEKPYYH